MPATLLTCVCARLAVIFGALLSYICVLLCVFPQCDRAQGWCCELSYRYYGKYEREFTTSLNLTTF